MYYSCCINVFIEKPPITFHYAPVVVKMNAKDQSSTWATKVGSHCFKESNL